MPAAARIAAVLAALFAPLAIGAPALAATFTVSSPDDAGAGTLRQAILDANAAANSTGPDQIVSNLASGSTITLASLLPTISDAVNLDGNGLMIDLNDLDGTTGDGLFVSGSNASGTVIRELSVMDYSHFGINVTGAQNVDLTLVRTSGSGDGDVGVRVGAGADLFEIRNTVVTGNLTGVELGAPNGTLANNLIGVTPDGGAAGNGIGVDAFGTGATIENNVIGSNTTHALVLRGVFNPVYGNYIGRLEDGTPRGNGGDGVRVDGIGHRIGLTPVGGAPNHIENGGGNGINVVNGFGNGVGINVIRNNALDAINLGPPGREENDTGDGDNGPNFFQNFPTFTSATSNSIVGRLNTNADTRAYIQFFSDPTGGDDLETFIGAIDRETDGAGNLDFTHVPTVPVTAGSRINAFATTQDGSGPVNGILVGTDGGGTPATGGSGPGTPAQPDIPETLRSFPDSVKRLLGLQGLATALRGRKLKTWTDYRGLDPEVNNFRDSSYTIEETLSPLNRGWRAVVRTVDIGAFENPGRRSALLLQRPRRKVARRTFTSLRRGQRIAVTYRIRPARGRPLPKVLRFRLRQTFTLKRPGFKPLTVKRTRTRSLRTRRR